MGWWIAAAAAGIGLLILLMTAPGLGKKKETLALSAWAYAHRGLHGDGIPENSLAAFEKAAQMGFGIELDVRLTRDGEIAVLHDETLLRMCGVDTPLSALTLEEAKAHSLAGTKETIPSFREALALVHGRVPLIIEMKSEGSAWKELPGKVFDQLKGYEGLWCVESFDPRMLYWFRGHALAVIRGQLAFDPFRMPKRDDAYHGFRFRLGAWLLMNFVSRPHFIAYGYETAGNLMFRMTRAVFRPVMAAWTVRSREAFEKLEKDWPIRIFEGFIPYDMLDPGRKGERSK